MKKFRILSLICIVSLTLILSGCVGLLKEVNNIDGIFNKDIRNCIPSQCVGYIYINENAMNKYYLFKDIDFFKNIFDILVCYPIKSNDIKEMVGSWDNSGDNYLIIYKLKKPYSQNEYSNKLLELHKNNLKNYLKKGTYPAPDRYEKYGNVIIYKLDYEDIDGNHQTEYSCVDGDYFITSNNIDLLKKCIDTIASKNKSLLDIRKKEYSELKSYINASDYDIEFAEFYPLKTNNVAYDCSYGITSFKNNYVIIKSVSKYPDESSAEVDYDKYYLGLIDNVRYKWNGKIKVCQNGAYISEETEIPISNFNKYLYYDYE